MHDLTWLWPILIGAGCTMGLGVLIKFFPREKMYNLGKAASTFLNAKIGKKVTDKIETDILQPFVQGMESDLNDKEVKK